MMQSSNPPLDYEAARWEFWTVCTCSSGNERDRPSPKFCVYKFLVCKLSDFWNLFAKSLHVDWPLDLCSRILTFLVFVTVHFMCGKQSSSVPFFVQGTNTFLHAAFCSFIISVFGRVVWEIRYVLEEKKYICVYKVQTPLRGWSCSISVFVKPGKLRNSTVVTSRIFTQILHSTML
jgi:hypothetical protein